ncbi:hypothetical protein SAMN05660964_03706 [Thiothrix caldifontis]|uniref:Phytanoyl-CoA dioxygenase (PhyH) n=1 Tax=Thiothrix caldifontis TaxID=525918 RepID=A0A1H4GTV6_9GAMM|nr:hypothetical protein [Thiothrix caldifontis]SEB12967.1 hypothetical protein SAMN05660964_03706 [Thiothrix caldifontis]
MHTTQEVLLATGECLHITNDTFAAAVIEGLQADMLATLVDGKTPALHMKNAVNREWCQQVADRFIQHPATKKEEVIPPIYSLGSHLYSCPEGEEFSCYFREIEHMNSAIANVLPNGHDPIVAFLQKACALNNAQFEYLSYNGASVRHGSLRLWGEGSQTSSDNQCYFAAPHEDYVETNANHPSLYQIHDSNNVYSIILCIDAVDDKEPETLVWNRRMTLEEICDPHNKHAWSSYGYKESIIEGVEAMSIRLKKGDAAIIPAHNVHAVIGYPGFRRCTYMAFFHIIKTPATGFSKMVFRT